MTARAASRPFEVEVPNIYRPLPEIRKALRKAYPKAGIVGTGIGQRRRGERVKPQIVVKIIVRRKRAAKDLRAGQRLPGKLSLVSAALGRRFRLSIATDVDEMPRAQATFYRIDPKTEGTLSVSAYAVWKDEDGTERAGLVTAGHGLWKTPASTRTVKRADVTIDDINNVVETLDVRCASHIKRDHVDVGLLAFPVEPLKDIVPRLKRIWSTAEVADEAYLLGELGAPNDQRDLDARFKFPAARADCESTAYYDEFPVAVEGWGMITMHETIESTGVEQTFVRGTSGSGIMTKNKTPRYALGIQSLALDPPAYSRSLATSFGIALEWLQGKVGDDLRLVWDPARFTDV